MKTIVAASPRRPSKYAVCLASRWRLDGGPDSGSNESAIGDGNRKMPIGLTTAKTTLPHCARLERVNGLLSPDTWESFTMVVFLESDWGRKWIAESTRQERVGEGGEDIKCLSSES